jgi:hypothetical protein
VGILLMQILALSSTRAPRGRAQNRYTIRPCAAMAPHPEASLDSDRFGKLSVPLDNAKRMLDLRANTRLLLAFTIDRRRILQEFIV